MSIFRILVAFALVVAGVVSTGCSGGGGGDGVFAGLLGPPRPQHVDITIANAQDVSATVVRADDQAFDFVTKIGGQIFPSPPAAPDLLSSNSKFELFATVAATGKPVPDTCAVSGTVTVSGQPENHPVSLSAGDVFDFVFDTCDDGDGYTLDGSFSLSAERVTGDTRTDVFRLSYEVQDMRLTVASGMENYTVSVSNGFDIIWDSVAFPEIVLTTGMAPFAAIQLSSQTDVYSFSGTQRSLTVNADISVSTTLREVREPSFKSAFGNTLYETIVPLQAPDGQDPQSGEISVGSIKNSMRIVIESGDIVRLDIDLDGDGIVDDTQYTTWAALRG